MSNSRNIPALMRLTMLFASGFFCLSASAADSYQFSFESTYSDYSTEGRGSGDASRFGVEAYLDPVRLDGSTPYQSAAFFQRVASLNAGLSTFQLNGLAQVMSGRVLNRVSVDSRELALRLSDPDLPVWGGVRYIQTKDGAFRFSDGSRIRLDDDSSQRYSLGYFLDKYSAVEAYYDDASASGLGLGFRHLFTLKGQRFIELAVSYQKVEYDEAVELEVANNVVRNESLRADKETRYALSVAFSPAPEIELRALYDYRDLDNGDAQNLKGLSVSWWPIEMLAVSAYYQWVSYSGDELEVNAANFYVDSNIGIGARINF